MVNGVCEDYDSCPIGSSKNSVTGQCETDDCPSGQYLHMGQCLDIPEPPTDPNPTDPTDPNPTDPTDPNPTDPTDPNPTDPADIDLSSIESKLNNINQSIKNSDTNNVNKLNEVSNNIKKTTDAVNSASDKNTESLKKIEDAINNLESDNDDCAPVDPLVEGSGGALRNTVLCGETEITLSNETTEKTYESTVNDFYARISDAPISLMLTDSFEVFNQAGSCPPLVIDLQDVLGVTVRSEIHCDFLEQIRDLLAVIMLIVFSYVGIKVIAEA